MPDEHARGHQVIESGTPSRRPITTRRRRRRCSAQVEAHAEPKRETRGRNVLRRDIQAVHRPVTERPEPVLAGNVEREGRRGENLHTAAESAANAVCLDRGRIEAVGDIYGNLAPEDGALKVRSSPLGLVAEEEASDATDVRQSIASTRGRSGC